MTDLKMCSLFFYFSERSSLKMEEHQRLLLKGTSFAKADEVWTAMYKKAQIYVFGANAVSNTSNTTTHHPFKLFTTDNQQWGRRY
jgi:hypothetical protein